MTAGVASRSAPRALEARQEFQYLSYLQYPAMLVALCYAVKPLLSGLDAPFDAWNHALLYAGVGVGLSSLQDPSRTQNTLSKKVWQDPRKGRVMLWVLALEALLPIAIGLVGACLATNTVLNQLSLGCIAFGLGMIGMLKTAIEMREHHRLDRNGSAGAALAGGRA